MKFYFFKIFVLVLCSLTISVPLKAETILVHFRKFSHQNPWQKGSHYERKVPAIVADQDFLLALLLPGEFPLFSETNQIGRAHV